METTTTTQTGIDEKIVRQINALLDRANHPTANENEAAVCAEKINLLLLKHNLKMEDVARKDEAQRETVLHETVGGGDENWTGVLASSVAKATYTMAVWFKSQGNFAFIGTPSNVYAARELFSFLREQIDELAFRFAYVPEGLEAMLEGLKGSEIKTITRQGRKIRLPKTFKFRTDREGGLSGLKARSSFIAGCSDRVANRLLETVKTAEASLDAKGKVTAVVAVRDAENKAYADETFGRLKNTSLARRTVDREAYRKGWEDGATVDMTVRRKVKDGSEQKSLAA